jgi:elongator complex protein 3
VNSRLKAFELMNHPTDKIELIVMGGTFSDYPVNYQYNFIKRCYDALNNKTSKNLESAKKLNEKSKHRCVALCIETRPDSCTSKQVKRMLKFGATRIEIGVQCLDDKIYKKINRGHNLKDVINATKILKNHGFKIGYHIMLGLPGSSPKKDFLMFKKLFSDEKFKPDQLKIYPCQVIKGSGLEALYERGKYKPYSQELTRKILIKIMKIIPRYCRVMRIMREIPPDYLTAGILRIDLRKEIDEELKNNKENIKEIRFREIGFIMRDKKQGEKINKNLRIKLTKYSSSSGKEYFLEYVNGDNILFGLCRLRIFNEKTLKKAFIRELHVYGQSLKIGEKSKQLGQHKGLGKTLLKKAEEISAKNKLKELKIISGVGVRDYYRKLGYKLDKNKIYMKRILNYK